MIQFFLIILFLSMAFIQAVAQPPAVDEEGRKAMQNLSFLAGDWEGEGWVMAGPGQKESMSLTENIRYAADSTSIFIESESNKASRPSIAVMIHYDSQAGEYVFNMSMSNGLSGRKKGEFTDGKFIWYQAENVRFTMSPTGPDSWHEIGEVQQDGQWFPVYEVNMRRAG
ncbi:hypothetical protein AB9P05_01370 [Roseivirga sp. BDSF3-8]|uniref:hypothetical protein n=1 Tax=Roseivirga sp. BDSF3-8 TaxID=3241598 RepID=UPI003532282F